MTPEPQAPKSASSPGQGPSACADCGKPFADRFQMRWDVRTKEGGYLVVCSSCFERREAERAPPPDDLPAPEGTTALLKLPRRTSGKARKKSSRRG